MFTSSMQEVTDKEDLGNANSPKLPFGSRNILFNPISSTCRQTKTESDSECLSYVSKGDISACINNVWNAEVHKTAKPKSRNSGCMCGR